ncbi:MAG: hypothetical protein GY705_25330, partial [Bacteroidetes bacterium]|nr:hypothetical protein [Bacteroidota bacterium]
EFLTKLDQFADQHNVFLIVRYHLNTSLLSLPSLYNTMFLPISSFPNSEQIVGISDALITDWSSIAFDMMAINKPIVFLDVPPPFSNGFTLAQKYRSGDLVSTFEELIISLSVICNSGGSYIKKHQQNYLKIQKKVYDNTLDGKSTSRYRDQINILLEN